MGYRHLDGNLGKLAKVPGTGTYFRESDPESDAGMQAGTKFSTAYSTRVPLERYLGEK